jgi:hypothetical protein
MHIGGAITVNCWGFEWPLPCIELRAPGVEIDPMRSWTKVMAAQAAGSPDFSR